MKSNMKKIWPALAIVVIAAAVGLGLWWWRDRMAEPVPFKPKTAARQPEYKMTEGGKDEGFHVQPNIEPVEMRFNPADGAVIGYRFDITSDAWVDYDFLMPEETRTGGGAARVDYESESTGLLFLKFYRQTSDQWNVAGVISELKHQINDRAPNYVSAIASPFTFRMNAKGYLDHLTTARGLPREAAGFIENLLLSMSAVLPDKPAKTWTVRETDGKGVFQARYTLADLDADGKARVHKSKLLYMSTRMAKEGFNPVAVQSRPRIAESRITVDIPLSGPWIAAMTSKESSFSEAADYRWTESSVSMSARLDPSAAPPDFPATFAQAAALLETSKYAKMNYYATDSALNAMAGNRDLEGALTLFASLLDADDPAKKALANRFMVNYFRLRPQSVFQMVDVLDGDVDRTRFDQSTQLLLWSLMAQAGHADAQRAFLQAAGDAARNEITRMRALSYAHDFEFPEPFMTEGLWELHHAYAGAQGQFENDMKTGSLLAIGSMANRLNEDIREPISRQLSDHLHAQADPWDQSITLSAIGNAGDPALMDEVAPYFSSADEHVRAHAYFALRGMNTPEAEKRIIENYEMETSPLVRAEALKNLSLMQPRTETLRWARRQLLRAQEDKEKQYLIEMLGVTAKKHPENEEALRRLLKENPSIQVKREIYRHIAPK